MGMQTPLLIALDRARGAVVCLCEARNTVVPSPADPFAASSTRGRLLSPLQDLAPSAGAVSTHRSTGSRHFTRIQSRFMRLKRGPSHGAAAV